jgi:hypothetical protein
MGAQPPSVFKLWDYDGFTRDSAQQKDWDAGQAPTCAHYTRPLRSISSWLPLVLLGSFAPATMPGVGSATAGANQRHSPASGSPFEDKDAGRLSTSKKLS